MPSPSLIGKFVLVNDKDHDHYRTGQICGSPRPGYYMVQFDTLRGGKVVFPREMFSIEQMTTACENCGTKDWGFFDTRALLDAYIEYLDAPLTPTEVKAEAKVHSLADHRKPH